MTRLRWIFSLVALGACAWGLLHFSWRGSLQAPERGWLAWLRANNSGAQSADGVSLLRADDSKERVFESWPLSPGDYAQIFKALRDRQSPTLAVAAPLSWERPGLLEGALVRSLKGFPNAVLGVRVNFDQQAPPEPVWAALFGEPGGASADAAGVPAYSSIVNLPLLKLRRGLPLGFQSIEKSVEGGFGQGKSRMGAEGGIWLLARGPNDVLAPSLALRSALLSQGLKWSDADVRLGVEILAGEGKGAAFRVPIDDSGRVRLDADLLEEIPIVNASSLLLGKELEETLPDSEKKALASLSENVVVLVEEEAERREFEMENGEKITCGEALALAVATIQKGGGALRMNAQRETALSMIFVLGALFVCGRKRRRGAFGACFALMVLLIGGSLACFQGWGLWFTPYPSLACLGLGLVLRLAR